VGKLKWACLEPPCEALVPGAKVGWLQGDWEKGVPTARKRTRPKCDVEGKDFVVASLHSLVQCGYPPDIYKAATMAWFDEMHHIAAETFQKAVGKFPNWVGGVTATPTRRDGLEMKLYHLSGPTCFRYQRLPEVTGEAHSVHVVKHHWHTSAAMTFKYDGSPDVLAARQALAADTARNDYLIALVQQGLRAGCRRVLLTTHLIDHGHELLRRCLAEVSPYSVLLYGTSPRVSLDLILAKLPETRVLIATDQMLQEGYDDELLDMKVNGLPVKEDQQGVGRVERWYDGKRIPVVHDLIDHFPPGKGGKTTYFPSAWFRNRLKFYRSRGFLVLDADACLE
jgi:superfamily II DNA or RNA helicase